MSLLLRWRAPERPIQTRWRGPEGMAEALARDPAPPVAAIIGPPGPQGPVGPAGSAQPLRIDAALSATWILTHPLGHTPLVQVFLASGELIGANVAATPSQITVTHAAPQTGFVLAY